jgi:hypothetical protein
MTISFRRSSRRLLGFGFVFAAALLVSSRVGVLQLFGAAFEYIAPIVWPKPPVIQPGMDNRPPSDAVVLFDGTDMSAFKEGDDWPVRDGYVTTAKHDIETKQSFGDCQLHLEWAEPKKVSGHGQGRGNSGVFMMSNYEIQVLDSYDNDTYYDGQCGAVYKQHPPMVNACRKPGEWQTYDIIWEGPRFDKQGKLTKPAYVTVLQNGIVVQNHFELEGGTFYVEKPHYAAHPEKMPIRLQWHNNAVRFRNIWIREIKDIAGKPGNHPHHPG